MATKTIVCPVCGSAVAPGRFACGECGALIAAVAPTVRDIGSPTMAEEDPRIGLIPTGADSADGDLEPEPVPAAVAWPERIAEAEPTLLDDDHALPDGLPLEAGAEAEPAPEPAPVSASAPVGAAQPSILTDLDPGADDEEPLLEPEPDWLPTRNRLADALPTPRPLAGAYLPPSAILPPLDAPGMGSRVAAAAAVLPSGAGPGVGARVGASIGNAFELLEVPADLGRRLVAGGAALAALAFVLPWVGTIQGGGFAGYFDRWGLAGPGVWIVVAGLVSLGAVAVSTGRAASWAVGLPAIVLATLVIGLVWPFVFGSIRSIGVWVALVGAIVMAVGGALDLRARHGPPEPVV